MGIGFTPIALDPTIQSGTVGDTGAGSDVRALLHTDSAGLLGVSFRARVSGTRVPSGFTLLELMITVAIVALLAVVASVQYSAYMDRVKVDQAKLDIHAIDLALQRYYTNHFRYPPDLASAGAGGKLDPWDRPYYYTELSGKGSKGQARKDRKLNPLNSDYDLFSAGKDGEFRTQIDQKYSLDDIIRARDGGFVDLAAKF